VPPPPPEEKPKTDTRALRGKVEGTVLVVDDEAPVRSIAVSMLRYLGYRVIEAEDGEEAITILRTSSLPIDAMLMDVYMPKLSGRDTFKQLRALGIDIPVIVCSGFMVEAAEFNALSQGRHGLVDVIQKPYSMETLASVIGKAVSKGHQVLAA
jgi:CheY-like chemotaxis protein